MFSASKSKGASGSYQIANSLRFRASASATLTRTFSAPTSTTKCTFSAWVKRGILGSGIQTLFSSGVYPAYDWISFGQVAADYLSIVFPGGAGAALYSPALFRDPAAWYHIVVSVDTTQATDSNRVIVYVNGVKNTLNGTFPAQNYVTSFTAAVPHTIGNLVISGYGPFSYYFDGYLAEVNFIDGQALTPSSFGAFDATSGVWQATKYSGTYGTNGFYLKFSDTTSTTTLCYDYSGNSNNWTPNNISLTAGSTYDSMLDSPTNYDNGGNGVGNYAVLNPLTNSSSAYVSNGNLTCTSNDTNYRSAYSSIGVSSGKWYCEVYIGLRNYDTGISVTNIVSNVAYYYLANNGNKWDTSAASTAYGATYTTGDTIGVAFDADVGSLTFYKNGTSQGVAFTGMAISTYQFLSYTAGTGANISYNFGQRPFSYSPPAGFKSLCSFNLPSPTILNGASYMAATLYTGTGATQSISNAVNGVSFQPDLVWFKARSNAYNHELYDSVRGVTKRLQSNLTNAESTSVNALTSFNSNGFTEAAETEVGANGATYVAWNWKAGGTAVTNTAGSITSQVSANTIAGFSVVTYTGTGSSGATVGHGLGAAVNFIIIKNRISAYNWRAGHSSLPSWSYFLQLDGTNAQASNNVIFNGVTPTSSVFTLGNDVSVNASGQSHVAYCFAAIPGYSAFGSYAGNGSADGPFIYTGFRPRFLLVKSAAGTSAGIANWLVLDTARSPYNAADYKLAPNLSGAENGGSIGGAGSNSYDILSNGFKARTTNGSSNESGSTYIYAAFAENPFQISLAR